MSQPGEVDEPLPEPIPDLTSEGLLPVGVFETSLDELERVFVEGAPFEVERRLIMNALRLYAARVWQRFPDARLWINGGFVTLKDWAPPKDADVVVVVPDADIASTDHLDDLSLWTLLGVSVDQPMVEGVERVQPMAGLIDGFYVSEQNTYGMEFWRGYWQRLKVPGEDDKLNAKGFVEVRNT